MDQATVIGLGFIVICIIYGYTKHKNKKDNQPK